ncbi:MAG: alpha/beta hydrolase [Bdellovibrionaceae bacterium]|nr:alpha/beta hydrolase [Pseudobdellovibrionaceae bacterium]
MSAQQPWIFIRGLARNSQHWGDFTGMFQARFPLAEVEKLDLAGNGHEAHRPSFLSILENVEDLRRRTRVGQGRKVSLCTISMGSMVGILWAHLYPDEVERLVIMNTSSRDHSRFFERLRPGNYVRFLRMAADGRNLFRREKEVIEMTTQRIENIDELAHTFAKIPPTSVTNFFRQLWAASTFHLPEKPSVPLIFLVGDDDELVKSVCSKRIAQLWKSELRVHPTAGHDLPLDAPKWICDQIESWIQSP